MAKLWVVVKREYLERVRTKWFIIATIFGPLFFGTIMIVPSWLSVRSMANTRIGAVRVLDLTGSGLGAQIAARLAATPQGGAPAEVVALEPTALAAAESLATSDVMRKTIEGYLVVDSGTVTRLTARYAGRNAGSIGQTSAIEGAVRQALLQMRLEREGLDAARIETITKVRVTMRTEKIDDKGRGGSGTGAAIFGFAIAFLLYFSIVFYGQNILRGVLEEKTTRVAEVVLSSVSPDILLAGKVLGVGAVGLTQQVAWIGSTMALWKVRTGIMAKLGVPAMDIVFPSISPGMILLLVAFFLLGYTFYASLFAAVGAMSGSPEEAQQAAQPVIMLLVSAVIFIQPVLLNPNSGTARIMSLLPFSSPIIMPLRLSGTQVPPLEIAGALLGVAAACATAVWLAARIYRVGLLMTGKRPTLKELVRWIRYA